MRLTGVLLDVEDYAGEFVGENGSKVNYEGKRLHVLDGREVVKVKIPKDQVNSHGLGIGEAVDLRVSVTANAGARSAYLTILLVGPWEGATHLRSVASG